MDRYRCDGIGRVASCVGESSSDGCSAGVFGWRTGLQRRRRRTDRPFGDGIRGRSEERRVGKGVDRGGGRSSKINKRANRHTSRNPLRGWVLVSDSLSIWCEGCERGWGGAI